MTGSSERTPLYPAGVAGSWGEAGLLRVTGSGRSRSTDPSMIRLIKDIYPDTQHLLCIFHIDLNLRKKLKGKMRDQFEPFCAKFLAMRNSLCPRKFEIEWEALINKFPACEQYLTRVLYPCKNSWASFAINRNFTAGIQSTQRVESTNKIIKDKLSRSSSLTDVVKEIQKNI